MVSSSAAQIESVAGDNIKTKDGKPDYGKIGAILIGVRIRQLSDGRKYLR
jgi:SHS family lactate transporter-like MFS transporter